MLWWLNVVVENQKKRGIDENKCEGGIDLFITYVIRVKKKKKKEWVRQERKIVEKKWINVPFPMI